MSLLDTSNYDNLIAGQDPDPTTRNITVKSGENLVRGQVAAIETSTGKVVAYDSSEADGHNAARFIVFEDVDATSGDAKGTVYTTGRFNESALVFTTTGELDDTVREALRDYGIIVSPSIQN